MKAIRTLMMVSLTIFSLAVFAQDSTQQKSKMKTEQTVVYACPMKCEGNKTYDKPGKCPKCGMNLKLVQAVAYACPMKCEGDKTYDKPGKCPKCGMNLKEKTDKKDDHSGHNH
jgi:Cu2+-exporting ATPase